MSGEPHSPYRGVRPPSVMADDSRPVCRRHTLLVCALLGLLACGPGPRPGTPPDHLLLITIESLRADHFYGLGYARATTFIQHMGKVRILDLDRVAETGTLFASAFAPSPDELTSLDCLHRSAVPSVVAGPAIGATTRLATWLGEHGWRTAAFAAPSRGLRDVGLDLGFESFEEGADEELIIADAIAWLHERVDARERHFLWLHLGGPSPPFEGPALEDQYTGTAPESAIVDLYDGQIARSNAIVRRFLDGYSALTEFGLERTLIVFAGTQGIGLPGDPHRESFSAQLEDAWLRVPLVFRHPESLTGHRILDEPVELADVLPTLADWLGLPLPAGARGRSLLPLVDAYVDRPFDSHPAFAAEDGLVSARADRHRLIARTEEGGTRVEEVLRLTRHPLLGAPELLDLDRESELVESLRMQLDRWLAANRDAAP